MERARGEPPDDPSWRADALAQSGHSRLEDELRLPDADFDPQRAETTCAEVARAMLGDLAPALALLPPPERRRARALAAFTRTLFDFARQSSLEGEKLSQINRWCFDLEAALDGDGPGQPVFVMMALADRDRPWPREALDAIADSARNRAMLPRVATVDEATARADALGGALASALLPRGERLPPPVAGALLRVRWLLTIGEDERRHQTALAIADWPSADATGTTPEPPVVEAAIVRECRRLRPLLADADLGTVDRPWRSAVAYLLAAARRHLRAVERAGAGVVTDPPSLGALARLALLARARWR